MGSKTKIEWCDATWNPVTGCLHGCEYCYARKIAERYGLCFAPRIGDPGMEGACKYDSPEGLDTMLELRKPYRKGGNGKIEPYPMAFLPTFHKYRLGDPKRWKKPRTIFVCSMADLFGDWVPDEWIDQVMDACDEAPQHRYLFLTKNGKRYEQIGLLPNRKNFWYGTTRTGAVSELESGAAEDNSFLSIEPLLAPLDKEMIDALSCWDWIIIGAETGNRRGKIVPEKAWIDDIVAACAAEGVPLFMKDSLIPIIGEENMKREFPWEG